MKRGASLLVLGVFLMVFMIGGVFAILDCQVYDDFSQPVLNQSRWWVNADPQRQNVMDGGIDKNLQTFYTQQNTTEDRRVYLVPKIQFTIGDQLSYDVNVINKSGHYGNLVLISQDDFPINNVFSRLGVVGYNNGPQPFDELGISHIKLVFLEKSLSIIRISPSGKNYSQEISLPTINGSYRLLVGSFSNNNGTPVHIDYDNFVLCNERELTTIEKRIDNLDQRVSSLESNITLLQSWKQILENHIEGLMVSVGEAFGFIEDQNARIINLENKSPQNNTNSFPNYFKYLSSSERKAMVCGYGQENNLTTMNDLGFNCIITYKTNQYTKKVTSSCKCTGK